MKKLKYEGSHNYIWLTLQEFSASVPLHTFYFRWSLYMPLAHIFAGNQDPMEESGFAP